MNFKQGLEIMKKVSQMEVTPVIKQELQYQLEKAIRGNKVTEKYIKEIQIEILNQIDNELEMREFLFKAMKFNFNFTKDYVDIDLQKFNLNYSDIYRKVNSNVKNRVIKDMKERFITQEYTEEQIVKQIIFYKYNFFHNDNGLLGFMLSSIYSDYKNR